MNDDEMNVEGFMLITLGLFIIAVGCIVFGFEFYRAGQEVLAIFLWVMSSFCILGMAWQAYK